MTEPLLPIPISVTLLPTGESVRRKLEGLIRKITDRHWPPRWAFEREATHLASLLAGMPATVDDLRSWSRFEELTAAVAGIIADFIHPELRKRGAEKLFFSDPRALAEALRDGLALIQAAKPETLRLKPDDPQSLTYPQFVEPVQRTVHIFYSGPAECFDSLALEVGQTVQRWRARQLGEEPARTLPFAVFNGDENQTGDEIPAGADAADAATEAASRHITGA